jgi:hypothetical protein
MTILIQQLYELVKTYLDKELYTNATFYAERLLIENDCEEFKYLLAKAYIGNIKNYIVRRWQISQSLFNFKRSQNKSMQISLCRSLY